MSDLEEQIEGERPALSLSALELLRLYEASNADDRRAIFVAVVDRLLGRPYEVVEGGEQATEGDPCRKE